MKLSIVTTLYKSSPYVDAFYQRTKNTASKITDDYEIIFVNDGSPDDSLDKVLKLYEQDPKVKIIDLSRNFGHHRAVLVGLNQAKGENVFLIDSDLEESPEVLEVFWNTLLVEKEYDVVYGVQESRKGGFLEKYGGVLFYKLLNLLSNMNLNQNVLTVRLMSRRYINALCEINEQELYMGGLFEYVGFQQKSVTINKKDKKLSTYTFARRLKLFIVGMTSFSAFPLIVSFYVGLIISIFSFLYGMLLVTEKFIFSDKIEMGWTSLMVSLWFLSGVILLSVGILGTYISKIFTEVKQRPSYVIKKMYERENHEL